MYQHDVHALADSVTEFLAQHEPLEAFREWFERLADYVRIKHGLGDALNSAAARDIVNGTYAPVTAAVGHLLAACEAAGVMRPGLDPADVLLLMGFLWRVGPGDGGAAQAARLFNLVINGFGP